MCVKSFSLQKVFDIEVKYRFAVRACADERHFISIIDNTDRLGLIKHLPIVSGAINTNIRVAISKRI